jgi:hypothetical protein
MTRMQKKDRKSACHQRNLTMESLNEMDLEKVELENCHSF